MKGKKLEGLKIEKTVHIPGGQEKKSLGQKAISTWGHVVLVATFFTLGTIHVTPLGLFAEGYHLWAVLLAAFLWPPFFSEALRRRI